MKKFLYLTVVLFLFLLSSCASAPQNRYFILNPTIRDNISHGKTDKTISVEYKNCDSRFDSNLIFYKKENYEFGYYAYSKWTEPVCVMVKNSIINAVNASKIFKNSSYSTIADYKLLFTIVDFEPVFNKNKNFVLTKIHFDLVDTKSSTIISSYTFKQKRPIEKIKIENIIKIMNDSLKDAVNFALARSQKTLQ